MTNISGVLSPPLVFCIDYMKPYPSLAHRPDPEVPIIQYLLTLVHELHVSGSPTILSYETKELSKCTSAQ